VPITRTRSGTWLIGGAACLLVVVVVTAVGMVIVANGTAEQQSSETTLGLTSLTGTPTTDPGLGGMAASRAINTMVARVLPSTVALRIQSANGATSDVTGLVAESGGIIVTASAALVGARSVTAIEADGTREATDPVGIDPATGLAVVRIDDDLPAATFDADDPPVGGVAVAAALEPASHTHAGPASVYAGTVMSAGQAPTDPALANGFSATAVDAPLTRRDLGCALLDARGHVSGMLVTTEGTGRSTMGFFLPGQLVLDVTRQLVTSGKVENGWLGVASVTAAPPAPRSGGTLVTTSTSNGAPVTYVQDGSPAASAGLTAGDLIVGIDGDAIHSTAEMRSMLYAEPPGSWVSITFEHAGTTQTTSAVLGDPDPADTGDDSSP
jgi:S1-C subfamily serine protease